MNQTAQSTVGGAADPATLSKGSSFNERFREIVSDPLNLMIARIPEAGYIDAIGHVFLHNGNRVPVNGPYSYYGDFSQVFIINRGVHEPLEEFCFQTVLSKIANPAPIMIELGCYWAHYSMWFKRVFPDGQCHLVEADAHAFEVGRNNFALNGFDGSFMRGVVCNNGFKVDDFMKQSSVEKVDILHSDIQGYEIEMLQGASSLLTNKRADYLFVSTHSQAIHQTALDILKIQHYRIEVSSDYDHHTTSSDGFILATSPDVEPVFDGFSPLGRVEIANSSPKQITDYAAQLGKFLT